MKRYEKYKPSGIEWIGEVPEHWEVMQLRRFAKVSTGSTPPTSRADYYDSEDVLWYTPSDFTYDTYRLGESDKKISLKAVKEYVGELFPKDSILMTGIGLVGKIGITPEDSYSNQQINAIFVDKSQSVEFVAYYLKGIKDHILSLPKASLLPILNQSETKQIAVALPPLCEQEVIAAYLDARCADIDKVVATQQKRIALLQELKQSEITKAVTRGLNPDAKMKDSGVEWIGEVPEGWGKIPLQLSANTFIDGDWIESPDISSEGIRYITTGNIGVLNYKEQGAGYITEETFSKLNCTEVFPGDILISRLNEPIGRCCIIPDLNNRIVTSVDNVIYRPKENVFEKRFVVYQMNCHPYTINANLLARGTTMHRISRSILGKIGLIVPPISEQIEIANYLDRRCGEIDRQIVAVTRQIELLREYKQALITEVVTGKRKVE